MPIKRFLLVLIILTKITAFSQTDGYWDKERATYKQITASAWERLIVPTEDLPVGTTEIVYRITLLDENQQMSNSLVSLLKAIPDPTGISQGSAGAVFLLSKISGDDKCKYGLFNSEELANAYKKDGTTEKACLFQNNPVNRDAKRMAINATSCLKNSSIWFGFENKNWILNQRIILEVVPWVDSKLSRGWTVENRKAILSLCNTTNLAKKLPNAGNYCVCVLDKIQQKYKFQEYQNLLAVEKTKAFRDAGAACYTESDAASTIYDNNRTAASQLTNQGKYAEAIAKLIPIIEENKAKVSDYDALSLNYLYTKQYDKAIKFLKIAEELDPTELMTQLYLAHAYLLNDKYSKAKTIYKKYRNQNVSDTWSWNAKVKSDFESFQKAGLPSKDFQDILDVLE